MPTITFSLKDLNSLIGKSLSIEQLDELFSKAKGELEDYNKDTDEVKLELGDTNQPYLWSAEGISILLKGFLGIEKGIPKLEITNSGNPDYVVKVDKSVEKVRPYIVSFIAKGKKIDDYILKQLIQLQEKLADNFGRKREKIAIGIYPLKKIKFPVIYKAVKPDSIKFIPLESSSEMTPKEILENHPKGKKYAKLLDNKPLYPILIDGKNEVLSFPPIINSELTGKVSEGDSELFFEATGTELKSLNLVANIFALALSQRGFKIFSSKIEYPDKKITVPNPENEEFAFDKNYIKKILGLDLKETEIKSLLEKLRYDYKSGKSAKVIIPFYRADIMHSADIVEDIGIAFGYDNVKEIPLTTYTVGKTFSQVNFIDKISEIIVGLGYNEIMSAILSNKSLIYDKMNIKDFGTVEIVQYMSETFSVVRTWILPVLMDCLSKNQHVEQPHKIFEHGLVSVRKGHEILEYERIALVSSHEKANFTEMKQILDLILKSIGLEHKIEETEHTSFIPGRVGRIIIKDKKIGFIGEIHPHVLENFGIESPACAMELNLSDIFFILNSRLLRF